MARRNTYDITEEMYEKAILWLENSGTKKGACDILKVTNNKTMERLLDEYVQGKAIDKQLRAKKRKEAVTPEELCSIIESYLSGDSYAELSDTYYRSTTTIKHHIQKHGADFREVSKTDPLNPPMFPDIAMADSFEVGEMVWSAKYQCIAQVHAIIPNPNRTAYRIRVWTDSIMEYSYQPADQLGNLDHLIELGIDILKLIPEVMSTEEIAMKINKTLLEANKRKDK